MIGYRLSCAIVRKIVRELGLRHLAQVKAQLGAMGIFKHQEHTIGLVCRAVP